MEEIRNLVNKLVNSVGCYSNSYVDTIVMQRTLFSVQDWSKRLK